MILPSLETICEKCEGSGIFRDSGKRCRCDWCNSAGYVPTEFGEKVLALMRHNFKPMLQDATDD